MASSTSNRVYLDWNATAPLRPIARQSIVCALDISANPSSVHHEGRAARQQIEAALGLVAELVGARGDEVVFTSGATEANAMVFAGGWDTVLLAGIEHASVREAAAASGAHVVDVATNSDGLVTVASLDSALTHWQSRPAPRSLGRTLFSLQAANNETGLLQDLAPVFADARRRGIATHCDAVQIVGRLPFSAASTGADFISISAHKIGGPQGIGALIVRNGVTLRPLIAGGGQQRNRRGGTENVAAIAGFGAAARSAVSDLECMDRITALRDRLETHIRTVTPNAVLVGGDQPRLPNTCCVALPGRNAETLVIAFDIAGVAVSAGAACSSGKVAPSTVLRSMGFSPEIARGAVRMSIGITTTQPEIDRACDVWTSISRSTATRNTTTYA